MLEVDLDVPRAVTLLWIGRLGDILLGTPVMAGLKSRFPNTRLSLVTGERGAAAARLCPGVDRVLRLRPFYHPGSALSLSARLLLEPCDLLIDLNTAFSRSSWTLAALSRARRKLAFRKGRGDFIYTDLLEPAGEREHMLDRYGRLAAALNLPYEPVLRAHYGEVAKREAESRLSRLGAQTKKLILIHPGNFKKFDNRWPEEKFAALAERLRTLGLKPIYLAGPGELPQVTSIAESAKPSCPVLGPLSLELSAAVLARASLLIGNATGTAHLATAVGTPTFCLLSRYTDTIWMPKSGAKHFKAVSSSWESCRNIPVEMAWTELRKALSALSLI